jgi:hypothetical protein
VTRHPRIDLRDVRVSVGVAPRSVEEDGDVHPPRPARICMASPPFPRGTRCRGRSTAWTRVSAIRHSGITATQAADVRCRAIRELQQVAFRSPLRCSGDCSSLRRPARSAPGPGEEDRVRGQRGQVRPGGCAGDPGGPQRRADDQTEGHADEGFTYLSGGRSERQCIRTLSVGEEMRPAPRRPHQLREAVWRRRIGSLAVASESCEYVVSPLGHQLMHTANLSRSRAHSDQPELLGPSGKSPVEDGDPRGRILVGQERAAVRRPQPRVGPQPGEPHRSVRGTRMGASPLGHSRRPRGR